MEQVTQKITKLVAIYARVSTGRQEKEETIQNQLMVLKEFIEKNNYTLVREYTDEGWSGDSIVRPALDQLRIDAKNKIWEAVMIYDPDRLARRYSYQELVMDELTEVGIEIIFITTPTPKNDDEKVMHGVKGLFSQWERAKITERFRLGKLRKAKDGHIITSGAKYGYTYIRNDKENKIVGHYEINKQESEVVKMIFLWVTDERLTLRAIVRRLHELNIKPRKSKRGVWNTSTLSTMLRDRTYIGEGHYLRSYGVIPEKPLKQQIYKKVKKTSRKLRPKEEWILIPTPVIIDKQIFDKVGQILKDNFTMCVRNKKNDYLLAGKIYCTCGRRRAGEGPQHGKHLYYRCTDRVYSHPMPPNCNEGGLNARILDQFVWDRVKEIMTVPDLMRKELSKWLSGRETNQIISGPSIEQLNEEAEKLKKEADRYVKAYGAGAIKIEQLKQVNSEIDEKMSSIKGQIMYSEQQRRQAREIVLPTDEEMQNFCQEAKNVLNYFNFQQKKDTVRDIIEKVTGNQKEVLVEGCININQDYHVALCSIGRNCGVAECGQVNTVQNIN
ncbi:MAG: recombinase family protein [Patescibacteria group bacterium]